MKEAAARIEINKLPDAAGWRFFADASVALKTPSVHSMLLRLERRGFIQRVPGQVRSITRLIAPETLPPLKRIQG